MEVSVERRAFELGESLDIYDAISNAVVCRVRHDTPELCDVCVEWLSGRLLSLYTVGQWMMPKVHELLRSFLDRVPINLIHLWILASDLYCKRVQRREVQTHSSSLVS